MCGQNDLVGVDGALLVVDGDISIFLSKVPETSTCIRRAKKKDIVTCLQCRQLPNNVGKESVNSGPTIGSQHNHLVFGHAQIVNSIR